MINPVLDIIVKQVATKLPDLRIRSFLTPESEAYFDYGRIAERDGQIVVFFSGYADDGIRFNIADEDIVDQLVKFMTPVAESNKKVLEHAKQFLFAPCIPYQNPASLFNKP